MKIMLVGNGGREHALAWKLAQSPMASEFVLAPGSDAMMQLASDQIRVLRFDDIAADNVLALVTLAQEHQPDIVVVGPENPLADGLADKLKLAGICVFGPSAAAAQLEASKAFTKELCARYNIPAARSKTVSCEIEAARYLDTLPGPYVLKADGLAAGKGVIITDDLQQAKQDAKDMLCGQFGKASATLVIEEFLTGEEASLFVLCDGKTAIPMAGAQDHKRAFDGDNGPNTGGMGCYSPAPILDEAMTQTAMEQIIKPTLLAMTKEGKPFCGILYAGLMIDKSGPKLIEYNVRFGDPECQVLMRRLQSDLLPVLLACAKGNLEQLPPLQWSKEPAACVVMAASGYPGQVKKGAKIGNLHNAEKEPKTVIFHAGTKYDHKQGWLADGGRVLNITASGADLSSALDHCYNAIAMIDWPQGFYRRDIGWRAL